MTKRMPEVRVFPAFAAELKADPNLKREHDTFEWLPVRVAVERLGCLEQRRLITLVVKILRRGGPSADLLVPAGPI